MKLPIYQVDAFSKNVFGGNPAAVCPLGEWLPSELMQKLAMENNLSETAFIVPEKDGYGLRWFTPTTEVDLCGHATLATAHVLFEHLAYPKKEINFYTKSGKLVVQKEGDRLMMDFPADKMEKVVAPPILLQSIGVKEGDVYRSDDYMVVLQDEEQVASLEPNFSMLAEVDARGVIVTAPGKSVNFVSRFFAPQSGINEDPVTGSAHTKLVPYWAQRLGKNELEARQISKRGGDLSCRLKGDRVEILGHAATYLTGEIEF
ncbi:MAG: PhzF family phenazine biosynthesis protein [Balneolaceae bacterium]